MIDNAALLHEIIKACTYMEEALTRLGATGRGAHEKISSVENLFTTRTIRQMRYIATMRNQAVHENHLAFDGPRFREAVRGMEDGLRRPTGHTGQSKQNAEGEIKVDTVGLCITGVVAVGWLLTTVIDLFD